MHQAMVSKVGEGNMFWGGAWFTCDIRRTILIAFNTPSSPVA